MPDFTQRLKELKEKAKDEPNGSVLVVCHKCGYPWISGPDVVLEKVSCPSCGSKTRRIKEEDNG